ncbi:hypothetical protein C8Q80DRAFT_1116851 [Daedaleopsis nitida]|nr:hypothetical protein C8Q80DRAFT_1116851 [Daedaleopsis nitida]
MGYALTDARLTFTSTTARQWYWLRTRHFTFDFIEPRHQGMVYVRKNCSVGGYPMELHPKFPFKDVGRTQCLDFAQRYLRMERMVVFKLSHDVLQRNSHWDPSKLVLSSHSLHVTHIDKNYKLTRDTLSEATADALRLPVQDLEIAWFRAKPIDKLRSVKEVSLSINGNAMLAAAQAQGPGTCVM